MTPTLAELQARFPEAEVSSSCCGEVVVYTGLRIDPQNGDGPLIPHECPNCFSEDPEDECDAQACPEKWHVEPRLG